MFWTQPDTTEDIYPYHLFLRRLIGRDGKQQRSPRSPDLSPTYVYLWRHTHGLAFQQISEKRKALLCLILNAASSVKYNPVELKRDICSIPSRATMRTEVRVIQLDTDCEFSKISFMVVDVLLFFNIRAVINPQSLKIEPMFIWHDYEMAAGSSNASQYYTSEITSTSYGLFWFIVLSLIPLLLMLLLMLLWFTIVLRLLSCFCLLACLPACLPACCVLVMLS